MIEDQYFATHSDVKLRLWLQTSAVSSVNNNVSFSSYVLIRFTAYFFSLPTPSSVCVHWACVQHVPRVLSRLCILLIFIYTFRSPLHLLPWFYQLLRALQFDRLHPSTRSVCVVLFKGIPDPPYRTRQCVRSSRLQNGSTSNTSHICITKQLLLTLPKSA